MGRIKVVSCSVFIHVQLQSLNASERSLWKRSQDNSSDNLGTGNGGEEPKNAHKVKICQVFKVLVLSLRCREDVDAAYVTSLHSSVSGAVKIKGVKVKFCCHIVTSVQACPDDSTKSLYTRPTSSY